MWLTECVSMPIKLWKNNVIKFQVYQWYPEIFPLTGEILDSDNKY